MLRDVENRDASWFRDRVFDVCIVGTGPAGMSLALALADKGWQVGLFEGGGLEPSEQSTQLYAGKNVGLDYIPLDACRLRYFGGTSGHWNGMCRQLEAIDFVDIRHSAWNGWPIRKTDLDGYAPRASSILDIKPADSAFDVFSGKDGALIPFQFRFSKPTRFGDKYRGALSASRNIQTFLNANLVDLDLAEGSRRVLAAIFRSYSRPEPFSIHARNYVLCLGGLENPRFLLNTDRQVRGGVGNEHDLVGRYFCEHLTFRIGQLLLEPWAQARYPDRFYYHPTPDFVLANRINNFGLRMEGGLVHAPDSALRNVFRKAICDYPVLARVSNALRGVEIGCYDAIASIMAGQEVNPQSRIRLGNELDRFGMRRIELDWRLTEQDKRTLRVAALELGKQMILADAGRLKINEWLLDPKLTFPTTAQEEVGGNHHMCTTRMSDDPRSGVVDRNCRLHSVDNLYLGGSSVFATPGYCNPTFTIVQLALRLADHIDGRLRSTAI